MATLDDILKQALASLGGISRPPAPPINPKRFAVPYLERTENKSPRYQATLTGAECECDYIVPWQNNDSQLPEVAWFDAVKDLLGYPTVMVQNNGAYIQLYLPDDIPFLTCLRNGVEGPARPFMYCTKVRLEGSGEVTSDSITAGSWQQNLWGSAFLTATYETLEYDILDDVGMVEQGCFDLAGNPDESSLRRFVVKKPAPSTRYQTLPQGSFVLVGPNLPYPSTPGRLEPTCEFVLTWKHVPTQAVGLRLVNPYIANTVPGPNNTNIPYSPPIEDCLGSVNMTTFAGCARGTLLLTAVTLVPIQSPIGPRTWDIEYRFSLFLARSAVAVSTNAASGPVVTGKPLGHNLVLYVQTGAPGYYEIVSSGVGPARNGALLGKGSVVVTNLSTVADLKVGMSVTGQGVPPGTTIANITPVTDSINLSQPATQSGTVLLTFGNLQVYSNYLLPNVNPATPYAPQDYVNLFPYRDFHPLFQVPQLPGMNGNT